MWLDPGISDNLKNIYKIIIYKMVCCSSLIIGLFEWYAVRISVD